MSNTIFPIHSINRNNIHWEDYLAVQTPIEKIGSIYFKREDKFAPLGYGGINGSKLRQCIWLIHEYTQNSQRPLGIISGTSVKSPQLPMGSAVAEHYGLRSIHIIGATNPQSAIKHPNVELATWFGALFNTQTKVGYNPVLQRTVQKYLKEDKKLKDYFYLEYGITLDHKSHPGERVENFHRIGAEQLRVFPDDVENLIIPAGSCNSTVSILYGIAKYKPKNLKNIYLIGIGPNRIKFTEERLKIIQEQSGIDTNIFARNFLHNPEEEKFYNQQNPHADYKYNLFHFDLHTTKYVNYQDEVKMSYEGLDFHPTYESKVVKYTKEFLPSLWEGNTLFWIVGSKPSKESMKSVLSEQLGEFPKKITEYISR